MSRRPQLKSAEQVATMRQAGLIVAEVLARCAVVAEPGVSTQDLDDLAREVIVGAGATPSFLGLYGFPAHACISLDAEVVHGIPSTRRVLTEGSVLKVDVGAIVEGLHADAAVTVVIGDHLQAQLLSDFTRAALWAGIARVGVGRRLGEIGAAIESTLGPSYGIVEGLSGHGIGSELHQPPDVWNTAGQPGGRLKLAVGHCLAIEPMTAVGSADCHELDDGWTVVIDSGQPGAHWEHTVAVTPTGPWVLTAVDGGAGELAARGVAVGGPW